ncbi:hypothetical protein C8F04DRAFT_1199950 [Mycena alexandri]|uniref:Uncharacterized protein n=1 Tax=Mycena alexandri TaxID=1745969 RepID=A0AAD6S015_9AGAR|nr:hypothetical protein C8F04DRAFT_1199950 [Mycena alexandri]
MRVKETTHLRFGSNGWVGDGKEWHLTAHLPVGVKFGWEVVFVLKQELFGRLDLTHLLDMEVVEFGYLVDMVESRAMWRSLSLSVYLRFLPLAYLGSSYRRARFTRAQTNGRLVPDRLPSHSKLATVGFYKCAHWPSLRALEPAFNGFIARGLIMALPSTSSDLRGAWLKYGHPVGHRQSVFNRPKDKKRKEFYSLVVLSVYASAKPEH